MYISIHYKLFWIFELCIINIWIFYRHSLQINFSLWDTIDNRTSIIIRKVVEWISLFYFQNFYYFSGPVSWLPFFGSQFLLKRLTRELGGQHKAFLELSKRYASDVITVTSGSEKVFVISGVKLCKTVLKCNEFDGRPWNEFIKIRNMGKKQGIGI